LGRIAVLLVCALAVVAMLVPAAAAVADPEQEAIDELNQIRHEHGLATLRESASLHRSSLRYAREMIRRDYFGHLARIQVAAQFSTAGEVLAMHSGLSPQPRRTVAQWMHSPPHRALLLSRRFRFVGMGLASGRFGSQLATTWVGHFGAVGPSLRRG
jgi:uncharacterized protein YkwD